MLAMVWSEPAHSVGIARYTRKASWLVANAGPGQQDLITTTPLDGIISQLYPTAPELVKAIQQTNVPVVELSNRIPEMVVPRVMPDYYAVGTEAAEYFVGKDFKNLLYIGMRKDGDTPNSTLLGFKEYADQAGCSTTLLFTDDIVTENGSPSHSFYWDNSSAEYRKWFGMHIAALPKPVGIFSSQLLHCIDLLEGCLEAGMLIPEEVAIVTRADYDRECELTSIPLSNIAVDFELQGYRAAELLDACMNGEDVPPETVYVPPKPVVTRASSNIDAVEHRETAVIIGYILCNLQNNSLSVAEIIRETGIPQGKLYYCFEKHIGQPIAAYIAAKRIEKAAALLKTTGMKAEDIAEQCGFSDQKHFLRTLKRVKGLKFSEFREQNSPDIS